jgi:hypothetical protein
LKEPLTTKQITALPNPFISKLNLNITTDELLTITIKDIAGKIISIYSNVNSSFVVDAQLKNGIYFIDVQNQSGTYRKVLKVLRAE